MSDLPENFANHPPSITEAKADRDHDNGGTIWTPRDALIATLRKIDSGEINPDALIIGYRISQTDEARRWRTGYVQASPDYYVTLGILAEVTAAISK